ncbi:MAG: hypothetical protein QGF38_10435 [Rhodospirillales bacterium]|jgi:hypothetical protein|nr:hypothetical protein [Rhodospirillales bacterium]
MMKKNRLLTNVVCTVIALGFMAAAISFDAAEGGFRVAETWANYPKLTRGGLPSVL